MHFNFYLASEILSLVCFGAILAREIFQRNKKRIIEILNCVVFGMLLEVGSTYLAHNYSYSPLFLIKIFNIPLAVGVGWAVIIYCVMLLSDQYKIPWFLKPFMDALTALILDLAIDAVAIRLGFWQWNVPLDQEWYGVPFENLFGWILIVFSFSFITRFLRTLNLKRFFSKLLLVLASFLSYAATLIGLFIFCLASIFTYSVNSWQTALGFLSNYNLGILTQPQVQFWKLIFFVFVVVELVNIVLWAVVKYRRNYLWRFDLLSFAILSSFHLFFFLALLVTGVYRELPVLIFIGIAMFLVNCFMHFSPYLFQPRSVYIFKEVKKALKSESKKMDGLVDDVLR